MPDNQPDLIGSKEACRILDVDRATLMRWVQSGRLSAATKLPGKNGAFLFDRAVINELASEIEEAAAVANSA